jgi:hypothetical protein
MRTVAIESRTRATRYSASVAGIRASNGNQPVAPTSPSQQWRGFPTRVHGVAPAPCPQTFQPRRTSRTTMTQTTPAPVAPIPTSAKDMTPQQYAAARAEIRRGNVPTYQPAQGAK